jgi:hypothetical protein
LRAGRTVVIFKDFAGLFNLEHPLLVPLHLSFFLGSLYRQMVDHHLEPGLVNDLPQLNFELACQTLLVPAILEERQNQLERLLDGVIEAAEVDVVPLCVEDVGLPLLAERIQRLQERVKFGWRRAPAERLRNLNQALGGLAGVVALQLEQAEGDGGAFELRRVSNVQVD